MYLIKQTGEVEPFEYDHNKLGALQQAVGGYIEIVPIGDNKILIIDEEGKLKNKKPNRLATLIAFGHIRWGDFIVGDVLYSDSGEVL